MTNKIPNIRFKGFTDDWERKPPLEVFCDFLETKSKIGVSGGNYEN